MDELAEAILDVDSRGRLPDLLCARLQTRSAVMLWRRGGSGLAASDLNYFPEPMVRDYDLDRHGADPWVEPAYSPQILGQIVHHERLAPHDDYVKSPFFNEFIRGAGDDTCRCMGLTVHTPWGYGSIFLHRGLRQQPFVEADLAAAAPLVLDAMRGLALRARLSSAGLAGSPGEAALERLSTAVVIVRRGGHVVRLNASALEGVRQGGPLSVRGGVFAGEVAALQIAMAEATAASSPRTRHLTLAYAPTHALLQISVAPIAPGLAMVVFEPPGQESDLVQRLRSALGLSRGEAQVALGLCAGLSPAEIAERRRVSVETVRRQIKAIAQKLGASRQAQIVARVQRALMLRNEA